jgi:hypothetical protein
LNSPRHQPPQTGFGQMSLTETRGTRSSPVTSVSHSSFCILHSELNAFVPLCLRESTSFLRTRQASYTSRLWPITSTSTVTFPSSTR